MEEAFNLGALTTFSFGAADFVDDGGFEGADVGEVAVELGREFGVGFLFTGADDVVCGIRN